MSKRSVKSGKTPKTKKQKGAKTQVEEVKTCGEFWVEEIRDHIIDKNGAVMYLLKWEGYDEADNSWEFDQQLYDCKEIRMRFKDTLNGRHPPKYSWEEFDNFRGYLRRVISPNFKDGAVIHKLTNKSISICDLKDEKNLTESKARIEKLINELLQKNYDLRTNDRRRRAIVLANEVCKRLKLEENFGSIREFVDFVDRRAEIGSNLKKWSTKINSIIEKNGEGLPISVSNEVDDEIPTLDHYICESVFDKNKFKNKSVSEKFPVYGCQCDDCYGEREKCCAPVIGFPMAYKKKPVLSHTSYNTNVIFECNSNCKCGPNCANRVVQRGRKYRLELFKTDGASRGWGVRSLDPMPSGAYVSSYIGEVVSLNEANHRPTTYLFDLNASWDQTDNEYTYVIDANKYGNIVRFVNHSCDPNCRAIFVWSDSYDRLLPKVSLFTIRAIRANEELTYDYGMQVLNIGDDVYENSDSVSTDSGNASAETDSQTDSQPGEELNVSTNQRITEDKCNKVPFKEIECRCGAKNCRQVLYS